MQGSDMSKSDITLMAQSYLNELQMVTKQRNEILPLTSNRAFIDSVLKVLPGSFSCEEYISIMRVLRHSCAGHFVNAQLLTEMLLPQSINEIVCTEYTKYLEKKEHVYEKASCSEIPDIDASDTSPSDAEFKNLLTVVTQVLANYSSCKDSTCSTLSPAASLWAQGGVKFFSSLLNMSVSVSAQNALSATFAALNNCLLCLEINAAEELARSRQLCCQMALSVVDLKFSEMISGGKASKAFSTEHPSVEWFQIVVMKLLKSGHLVDVLQVVKRSTSVLTDISEYTECFSVVLTHEQVIYLCVLDTLLGDIKELGSFHESESNFSPLKHLLHHVTNLLSPEPRMTSSWYPRVVTVDENSMAIDERYAVYLSSLRPSRTAPDTLSATSCDQNVTSLDIDSLCTPAASVCIGILAKFASLSNSVFGEKIASFFGEGKETIGDILKQEMLDAGAMNICCAYLTGLNKIKTDKNQMSAGMKKVPQSVKEKEATEYSSEVARACLQVVMNLTYRYRKAQDYCRVIGGFTVVLSYCSTDFDSPLSREWALMCVRNLCEGNVENQEFVSSMQLQGVLKDELLERQGIQVEMDPARGKFSFTQKKKSDNEKEN
mmetsp:Transcript_26533/g.44857  ORF Transcript_26533/g.44857 Transcript_26533/m.44857 type:complete len:604 (+) Transcript_26533:100-1911(+)